MNNAARPWLVLDMDEGVLRREPTRRAAVDWIIARDGGNVLRRHCSGPGAYEYTIGYAGDDGTSNYFVERLDAAVRAGWDHCFTVPDKHPYPDRPHDQDPDIDRDRLLAQLTRDDEPQSPGSPAHGEERAGATDPPQQGIRDSSLKHGHDIVI